MTAMGIPAAAIAFLSCVILVPFVRIYSARYGFFDMPGPLKIHPRPVPRLGGVAIAISLLLGVLFFGPADLFAMWPVFAALALIWITGLYDDIRGSSAAFRLAAQAASAFMLWLGGWRLPFLGRGVVGLIGMCLFVVVVVNAFNFLDGSDGVAAGVAAIIGGAYIVELNGAYASVNVSTAWALVGACLGFLIFNFPPAGIFMGDSGSTALGFAVAFLMLVALGTRQSGAPAFTFAILPAALPLLDAGFAVIRRIRNRGSPFYGDRRHFYDLLLARGWSQMKVALTCYATTGAFCVVGWLALKSSFAGALVISITSAGCFLIAEWRLGSLRVSETDRAIRHAGTWRLPSIENSK